MLRAVKRTRLYEEIVAQLAELIRQGRMQPGDRLPSERELAEQLGVSRPSVREAIRAMEHRGLVVSRPGSGTYIAGGSAEGLLIAFAALAEEESALQDIFELRMLVEPPIASLAALRAAPDDIGRLESILREQESRASGEDGDGHAKLDVAFHSALAEATHNEALLRLAAGLMEVLAPSRHQSLQTAQRIQLSLHSHRRVLDAVMEKDWGKARRAMEDHIVRVDSALFGLSEEAFASTAHVFAHT